MADYRERAIRDYKELQPTMSRVAGWAIERRASELWLLDMLRRIADEADYCPLCDAFCLKGHPIAHHEEWCSRPPRRSNYLSGFPPFHGTTSPSRPHDPSIKIRQVRWIMISHGAVMRLPGIPILSQ